MASCMNKDASIKAVTLMENNSLISATTKVSVTMIPELLMMIMSAVKGKS